MLNLGPHELERFCGDIYKVLSSISNPLKDKVNIVGCSHDISFDDAIVGHLIMAPLSPLFPPFNPCVMLIVQSRSHLHGARFLLHAADCAQHEESRHGGNAFDGLRNVPFCSTKTLAQSIDCPTH